MSSTPRRAVIGPLDGEAGTEHSRIEADSELAIERAREGVILRQETTDTPNFEKVFESHLNREAALALRDQLDRFLAEG